MRAIHRRPALVLAVAVMGSLLATGSPAQAIANGEPVPAGKYLFSTKLTMTGIPNGDGTTRSSGCSGALIAAQWVLTAGHCFHDVNRVRVSGTVPYTTKATLGRVEVNGSGGVDVAVIEIQQSPVNDIALAKLAHPVTGITPIAIAHQIPTVGETLRLTGWGALNSTNPVAATHLQTGLFTVSSLATTTIGVKGKSPSTDTSACLYDSGAPYFRETTTGPEVVSTETDGPDCPHTTEETTDRVDVSANWIASQLP